MKPLSLNIKSMKKIKDDDKCAVFKHPQGHMITVAKSKLSPEMQKMLSALPIHKDEGGAVEADSSTGSSGASSSPPEPNKKNAAAVVKGAGGPTTTTGWENVKKELGFADGGEVDAETPPAAQPSPAGPPPVAQDSTQTPKYNPEDYIPVPKDLLQEHIKNLQALDKPAAGTSVDPLDFAPGPVELAGIAKAAVPLVGLAKLGVRDAAEAGTKGMLSVFKNEIANLGERVATNSFPMKAAASKEAQIAAGAWPRTAAQANNLDKGVQSAADVIMNNAGKLKNKGGMAEGGEVKQSNPKLEESKKEPKRAYLYDGGMGYDPSEKDDDAAALQDEIADKAVAQQSAQAEATNNMSAGYATPEEALATQAAQNGKTVAGDNVAPGVAAAPLGPENNPNPPMPAAHTPSPAAAGSGDQNNLANPNGSDAAEFAPGVTKSTLSAEDQAYQNDLKNGHITPETYRSLFANKGILGKIGMVFGALVGSAGAGLSHQPSAFLQIMDNEIKRDMEAQQQSKGNAQNFYRLTQQDEMNKAQIKQMNRQAPLTAAQTAALNADTQMKTYALTQSKMLQSSYHSLVEKVTNMPEGPQKEAAKQQLGFVYSKIAEKINDINDQAEGASAYTGMLFGGGGPQDNNMSSTEQAYQKRQSILRHMGPQGEMFANDNESKHIPYLDGRASIALTPGDREQVNTGMTFQNQLARFMDWTKAHSGDLNPADVKEGKALAAGLQGAYRQATHGGVYKAGEQDFISQIIDNDPTKFFNSVRVMPSLGAIQRDSAAQLNQLVKSKGFPGYQAPAPASVEGATFERRTPSGKVVVFDSKTNKPLRWK